jgi:succinyl-diaminopimelate desuccinylase
MSTIDAVELARGLIRRPSVTPKDEGALSVLAAALEPLGFACNRLRFSAAGTDDVDNLYARIGTSGPNFCFAGHTDVVPPGDLAGWTVDPFGAEIIDGQLFGRGAADMKSAVAAFAAAAGDFLTRHGNDLGGSISLLITGDEEGVAINGTAKVLGWMAERGERIDACVVGEPTSERLLGDMIKIGRRGSMTGKITVEGRQGHTAYPHLADNPNHHLVRMLESIIREPLDQGTAHFQPSTLQITTMDVGNPAGNVIPARAHATFNTRFNDAWNSATLKDWIRHKFDAVGGTYSVGYHVSGESFFTQPGPLSELVAGAIADQVGRRPTLSTTGGTSDARFIRSHAPVVECGLVGQTMHKTDERAALKDIADLTAIYGRILDGFFKTG